MPKLSLRIETLEKQVSELLLKDKKREKQNKRLELLEQQFEKTKSENLGKVENDFYYKYRLEVHKIFSNFSSIFKKINDFSLYAVLISFVSLLLIVERTNINKFFL